MLAVHIVSPRVRISLLSNKTAELFRNNLLITEVQAFVQSTQNPQRTVLDSALHHRTNHRIYKGHLVSYTLGYTKVFHQLSLAYKYAVFLFRQLTLSVPTSTVCTVAYLLVVLFNGVVGRFLRNILPQPNILLTESKVLQSFLQRLNFQRSTRRSSQVCGFTASNLFRSQRFVKLVNGFRTFHSSTETILLRGKAIISQVDCQSFVHLILVLSVI